MKVDRKRKRGRLAFAPESEWDNIRGESYRLKDRRKAGLVPLQASAYLGAGAFNSTVMSLLPLFATTMSTLPSPFTSAIARA
jgi:hypothetical protein